MAPKKRFGQNFLTDPNAAKKIADAAAPAGGTVLEIGPGTGALTEPLLERAAHVVAIERDPDLIPVLHEKFESAIEGGRITLIEGDATALDWVSLLQRFPRPHAVAGNVPYLITGRLIEMATNIADHIDRAVFMVQKEVADRLLAQPGTKEYGALTVFVAAAFVTERVAVVRRGSFFPRPEVDSAVVQFTTVKPRRAVETDLFREAVKMAFAMRRKTLRNAWRGLGGWSDEEIAGRAEKAGISLDARGETLGVEAFWKMTVN
ncbi:MAG: ribosomal RNA small subunit methyltransferase A [Polyangiaceae bacterium]|nr:ribosomal RNA small subunit methyltransferase A [Polyangiaceae bacterium]